MGWPDGTNASWVTHTKGLSWGNFETLDLRRDGNGKGQRRLVKELEEALRQRAAPGCGQCQIVIGKAHEGRLQVMIK
jgi:hypothetical protein